MHAFPNGLGHPRLGLSVSKRVGGAVVRNTVRRRLREVFHTSVGEGHGGMDFVISARPAASEASFQDLKEEFERALRRLEAGGV
ncbi:Ribonuclease P protein component [Rubrobacter xylanophilus DSM 9941]|nr:Ribonuclease P protein component [Rubrobacter xylanophilus DSM 9941]